MKGLELVELLLCRLLLNRELLTAELLLLLLSVGVSVHTELVQTVSKLGGVEESVDPIDEWLEKRAVSTLGHSPLSCWLLLLANVHY